MVERHYDEDALVTMLGAPATDSDPHLAACGECAERLEDFRMVTSALRDAATWDQREVTTAPNPNTIATLRAFADTMAAEDAAAQGYLAELLAGPRETWMANLAAHPEWRTAGVVRGLIAATDRALDTMPADALEITALATNIAEQLDPANHRSDTVARLRGAAWRERAYALYYTGAMAAAEAALQTCIDCYSASSLAEYETARMNIVRSLVERALERVPSAEKLAKESATVFSLFGDIRRTTSAKLAEIQLLFSRGRYQDAMAVLELLEKQQRFSGDPNTHALVLGNLGYCAWKLGNFDDALRYHEAAAVLLDDLGIRTEAVRVRWNVASVLASAGKFDEALSRLERVRIEFDQLGVLNGTALVRLEMAELLLAREEFAKVEEICNIVMSEFRAAGLAHTTRALTALAYMNEAVRNRRAKPSLVRHVRDYIRRLPDDAQLLFAPPPA